MSATASDAAREACLHAILLNANFREALLWMADMSFPANAAQWRKMAESATNEGVLFVRNP